MTVDPTPFLSTMVGASAALVAIIGGLLVARFVGLDSDQRGSRRVLADAGKRLEAARDRARTAQLAMVRWHAGTFFKTDAILKALIDDGVTDAGELVRRAAWPHAEEELAPFVAEVAEEAGRAREVLSARVQGSGADWEVFRRNNPDLKIWWPGVWEHIYDEIVQVLAEQERAAARAAQRRNPFSLPDPGPRANIGVMAGPFSDRSATAARRHDELIAASERAQQRVEDYEGELVRLQESHAEIVRPDSRLWWGITIVVVFAALGVALPLWVMSRGPQNLVSVRWVFWPFAACLVALVIYIVAYLAQLTRSTRP